MSALDALLESQSQNSSRTGDLASQNEHEENGQDVLNDAFLTHEDAAEGEGGNRDRDDVVVGGDVVGDGVGVDDGGDGFVVGDGPAEFELVQVLTVQVCFTLNL